ncbi:helix-turn-helix domain-containing protein [Nocardia carnea]|uniref:helix-turn-helix domain-containing protein n=1 Tax=Nocardia carnea TaxID=37328 RepID=UPI0002F8360F|nr:helix-turn-helix transcriptional regulator [Nocardia carnea]
MNTATATGTSNDHEIEIRVDALRRQRGLTWAELARRADITEANLYALQRGDKTGIRFGTLRRVCDALECTPGQLLVYTPESSESDAGSSTPPQPAPAQVSRA